MTAVQPTPKRDSVPRHWWKNRSATELAYDRQDLLEELTGPDGAIDGKLRGLVFPRWRARRHPVANLLLQYARSGCPVSVGRNWNPYEMEAALTNGPYSPELEDDSISKIQVEAWKKVAQGSNLKFSPLEMIPHKSRKYS